MPSKTPDEVAYVFGGPVKLTQVRVFMDRHNLLYPKEAYAAWEKDDRTTCVRAIADPRSGSARICGLMLVDFRKRHLRIEHILVEPGMRRKRIATNMFYNLVLDPRAGQYQTISAFCPDDNDDAIAWLRSCNFKAISMIPGKDKERDQYLFSWSFSNLIMTVGEDNAKEFGVRPGVPSQSGDIRPAGSLPDAESST